MTLHRLRAAVQPPFRARRAPLHETLTARPAAIPAGLLELLDPIAAFAAPRRSRSAVLLPVPVASRPAPAPSRAGAAAGRGR